MSLSWIFIVRSKRKLNLEFEEVIIYLSLILESKTMKTSKGSWSTWTSTTRKSARSCKRLDETSSGQLNTNIPQPTVPFLETLFQNATRRFLTKYSLCMLLPYPGLVRFVYGDWSNSKHVIDFTFHTQTSETIHRLCIGIDCTFPAPPEHTKLPWIKWTWICSEI